LTDWPLQLVAREAAEPAAVQQDQRPGAAEAAQRGGLQAERRRADDRARVEVPRARRCGDVLEQVLHRRTPVCSISSRVITVTGEPVSVSTRLTFVPVTLTFMSCADAGTAVSSNPASRRLPDRRARPQPSCAEKPLENPQS
jgi:hypothetical protein